MPSKDDIDQQQQLLATYRRNLAHELQRAAQYGGPAFAPVEVANSIAAARAEIRRIEARLRAWGVDVPAHPDDEASPLPAHERSNSAILGPHPSSPPSLYHDLSDGAAEPSALPGAAPAPQGLEPFGALGAEQPPPMIDKQAPSVAAAWSARILAQLEEALAQLEEKLKVLPYFWTTLDAEKPADEDIHIAIFFAGHRLATRASIDKLRELEDELQSGKYLRRTISKSIRQHITRIRERNRALDAALTIVSNYSNGIATALAVREAQASAKELIETLLGDFDETAILLQLSFIVIALESLERELKIVCDDLTDAISRAAGRPVDIHVKMIVPEPPKARLS